MAEKKKPRYGAWIIVGVILLGLAGFGTGGLSGNIRNIGTVGDKDVTVVSYQRALNEQIRALSAQFGQQISFQQAQAFGIDQVALSQVVLLRTLDNEASELGISVGDERVFDRLQTIPSFQGAGGFNRETYRLSLQQSGQTAAEFENGIREETARTLLQGAVVSGVPAPDAYADALVQFISETRSITWAVVDAGDLTAPVPGATEAAQQEYYDANPAEFTLPESRDITYVWLTPNMIIDDMVVADAAVEQLYNQRIAEFVQPERRLVERLVYLSQDRAADAMARVNAGEATFEDLVAERGLRLTDIDLGDVSQDDLGSAGEAVFAAETGTVVGPFNSPLGPALFRMNAVLAAQEIPLEEAAPRLRDELATDAAREFINSSADPIIDLLAGGATMADLAERTDMRLGTINWTPDNTDGIAAYDAFRREAAAVQDAQFPEVFDLADGGIFALSLDGIVPPTLQPIEDVRDALAAAWQAQAQQDAIMAKAEEISADILPLTGFDTLGLDPIVEENLTRRTFLEGTPPSFNDQVFEMAVGDVRVLDAENRALIVRLDDIAAPDLSDEAVIAQRDAVAENTRAGIAQDIFDAYATELQQRTEQRLNQQTIDAVNAQLQ
ncbi:peptidylprolyl isomerase [Roseobacter sp. CCS2]|uniref:peptidylprolyl isomerase n=1 Tax=Roseobacter sp. CCS2 TaxID=391593 RepID=UPI0000F3C54E|nr:peptidylprolyl isomerase [Roseobacter sp. CCS2]EBA11714.1 peptidyl-prolyl cis-trans isomerse D, putative [Roseobacter sp. CCS2]